MSSYQSASVVSNKLQLSSAKAISTRTSNWEYIYLARVDLKAKSRKHKTPLSLAPDPQAAASL